MVKDAHVKALSPAGNLLPDPPQANDSQGRMVNVLTYKTEKAHLSPSTNQDIGIGPGQVPGGGYQEAEGKVRNSLSVNTPGVFHTRIPRAVAAATSILS